MTREAGSFLLEVGCSQPRTAEQPGRTSRHRGQMSERFSTFYSRVFVCSSGFVDFLTQEGSMQTKQLSFFLSLLLTLCLFRDTQAQQAGRIESMKLLTPNVGWAATKQKLFWTTDGGAQWKDITPKLDHEEQQVSSVFFLDSTTGWIPMHCGDNLFPSNDP